MMYFRAKHYARIEAAHPRWTGTQKTNAVTKMWNGLTPAQKLPYNKGWPLTAAAFASIAIPDKAGTRPRGPQKARRRGAQAAQAAQGGGAAQANVAPGGSGAVGAGAAAQTNLPAQGPGAAQAAQALQALATQGLGMMGIHIGQAAPQGAPPAPQAGPVIVHVGPPVPQGPDGYEEAFAGYEPFMPFSQLTGLEARLRYLHFFGLEHDLDGNAIDQSRWIGIEAPLSWTGGFGRAGLFARLDESNHTVETMVAKEVTFQSVYWRDPLSWKNGVPLEAAIHRRVQEQNSPYILGYHGHRVFAAVRKARLYLEYAPYQTLQDVIDALVRLENDTKKEMGVTEPTTREQNGSQQNEADQDDDPDDPYYKPWYPMPEPFMWYVFESMVSALLVLHEGSVERRIDGWERIVHLDVNPGNVFLAAPDLNRFKAYPQPKLGDFGLAVETSESDLKNPLDYQGHGTEGFRAPEVNIWYPRRPAQFATISEKADIFSLGATMMCMIDKTDRPLANYESPLDELHEGGFKQPVRSLLPTISPEDKLHYLAELVRQCVSYDPAERPTLRELLRTIQTRITHAYGDTDRFCSNIPDVYRLGDDTWTDKLHFRELEMRSMTDDAVRAKIASANQPESDSASGSGRSSAGGSSQGQEGS